MCDFVSWIEKDGKLYWLEDDMIKAKWPKSDFIDKIGHSAIEEYFKLRGGEHKEAVLKIPKEIAKRVNAGAMREMSIAGQWKGIHYDQYGSIDAPWYKPVETLCKEAKTLTYFSLLGTKKKSWKVYSTRDAAWAAAWDAARDAARDAAWDAAWDAARAAAGDAARAAALLARCYVAGFDEKNEHMNHVLERWEVWQQGYGLLCDVNGVLYVYKKP